MRVVKKIGMMLMLLMLVSVILAGCMDEEYEDYEEYETETEQEYDDAEGYGSYDSEEPESDDEISESSGELDLNNYPMGTVKEVEGNIAVVTIVADDASTSWDFESGNGAEVLAKYHDRLGSAMEWLEKNIAEYGRDVHFIWDWEEHEELLYDASFETDLGSTINSQKEGIFEADEIIASRINSEAIMRSLNADGIVYMFAVNSDPNATNVSCSFDVGSGPERSMKDYWYMMEGKDEPPYEFLVLMLNHRNQFIEASTIAHEFIHSLSVPDLYAASDMIPQDFVDYAWDSKLTDIMQDDEEKGARITEVTAYYMGLIDHSDMVDEWGLGRSTH